MTDKLLTEVAKLSGWPLLALICIFSFLAPAVDNYLFPIRSHQRIIDVRRYQDRLCFDWYSVKLQRRVSDNMDSYLHVGEDLFSVAIYEEDTGFPWGKSRAVGLGWHHQRYCVSLPPSVKPTDTVRLTDTAYYPGILGSMWHVKLRLPDVVSRGTSPRDEAGPSASGSVKTD